jgi:hypothetical protein
LDLGKVFKFVVIAAIMYLTTAFTGKAKNSKTGETFQINYPNRRLRTCLMPFTNTIESLAI